MSKLFLEHFVHVELAKYNFDVRFVWLFTCWAIECQETNLDHIIAICVLHKRVKLQVFELQRCDGCTCVCQVYNIELFDIRLRACVAKHWVLNLVISLYKLFLESIAELVLSQIFLHPVDRVILAIQETAEEFIFRLRQKEFLRSSMNFS